MVWWCLLLVAAVSCDFRELEQRPLSLHVRSQELLIRAVAILAESAAYGVPSLTAVQLLEQSSEMGNSIATAQLAQLHHVRVPSSSLHTMSDSIYHCHTTCLTVGLQSTESS